jgi:hypothetical protein
MKGLSNHTKLMNIIICLSNKNRHCTPELFNNHYILESIELSFNKLNGNTIHADVCLINPKSNNFILLECKDGGLEIDQAKRYATLDQKDIINACVSTLSGNFAHEVVYLGSENKANKLINAIKLNSFNFPILVSDENKIKLRHNDFNCQILQKIFTQNGGVDLPNPVPTFFYPFGKDDSNAYILRCISPVLIGFRGTEFDVEDVIKQVHKLYEYIDNSSLNELKSRVGRLLNNVSKNELNDFFDLPATKKYKLKDTGVKRFQTALEKCISKLSKVDRYLNQPKPIPNSEQKGLCDF